MFSQMARFHLFFFLWQSSIILCVYVCAILTCLVVSNSVQPHGLQPASLLCSWGFSRQECWSGLPCPPPGDFPNPGIEPRSPVLQVDSLPTESPEKLCMCICKWDISSVQSLSRVQLFVTS